MVRSLPTDVGDEGQEEVSNRTRQRPRPPQRRLGAERPQATLPVPTNAPEPSAAVRAVDPDAPVGGYGPEDGATAELEDLRRAAQRARRASQEVTAAVERARGLRISWHRIGLVTGLTAEGARRRWGRE
jgi:hypothetical protein